MEGLRILFQLTPMLQNVNTQYSNVIANAGTTVNAYRADKRKIRRKTVDDSYTAADANVSAVPVTLDQYFYDSFVIKDYEQQIALPDLTRLHLVPAMQTFAAGLNRGLLGFAVSSGLNQGSPLLRAGKLNGMTKDNAADYILEAEQVLQTNLAPSGVRAGIFHQTANQHLMRSDLFSRFDARGTNPSVQTGMVGNIFNTNILMSQDVPYNYSPTSDVQSAAVNNTGGYASGSNVSMTVTDPGTDWTVGEYAVIAGNDQPTFVSATGGATTITLNEALKYGVVDAAVITHYLKCANEATERVAGYAKEMVFTHTSGKNLKIGQLLSFGTGASRHTYTVIEVSATTATTTTVLLNRPLSATVASGADAFPGPAGSYNPVLDRDAIALVTANMPAVQAGSGAVSAVVNFGGVGMRVVQQYDSSVGGTRFNFDLLAGYGLLDSNLIAIVLG